MGRAFEFRKGRKMKRWAAMAKAFTRIGKDIVMAVKEGGPNPESNSRLRAVMQNAKAANMPMMATTTINSINVNPRCLRCCINDSWVVWDSPIVKTDACSGVTRTD